MGFPYLFMHCCSLLLVVDLGMKSKGVSDLLGFIVSRMRIKTLIYYVTVQAYTQDQQNAHMEKCSYKILMYWKEKIKS
jgi:hypothetical protein